ncbi:MAG: L-threonylcarbamoyladenylate synthase [Planctomycetaceae bacterium]
MSEAEPIAASVEHAATLLRQGGIVAFPTETVYGLGADALNPAAVARIFEAKRRPQFDPLIVHLDHRDRVAEYVTEFPPLARKLADRFWPGPLTLLLRRAIVPDLVTAGLSDVGLRVPDHPSRWLCSAHSADLSLRPVPISLAASAPRLRMRRRTTWGPR